MYEVGCSLVLRDSTHSNKRVDEWTDMYWSCDHHVITCDRKPVFVSLRNLLIPNPEELWLRIPYNHRLIGLG